MRRWHIVETHLSLREKIAEMWFEFRVNAQFASNVPRIVEGLEEIAVRLGVVEPASIEPEPRRDGAPEFGSYKWIELIDPEGWFRQELGIGTKDDYFGGRNLALRERRIKQIAQAAASIAEEEKRVLIQRIVRA